MCDVFVMTTTGSVLARVAGFVMILGFVFLTIGDDPVVADVFGTSDVDVRLQAILAAPEAWDRAWLWSAIALITGALGFIVWAVAVAVGNSSRSSVRLGALGAVAAVAGCLIFDYLCYARAAHDPAEVAKDPDIVWWTTLFVPLVMAALALLGVVLRRVGMVKRGWVIIAIAAVSVPVCIVLPLLVPIVIAVVGAVLVLTRQSDWIIQQAS
jgi:hypothetical protein